MARACRLRKYYIFRRATGRPAAVAVQILLGAVVVTVVDDRAVVAAQNHQSVGGQIQSVERGQNLPDAPVEFHDHVPAHAAAALSDKTRVRHARHVRIVRGEIEKERLAFVPLDEVHGFAGQNVGLVLVFPTGRMAAGHEADAADAVNNSVVVALAETHLEQFRMSLAGRFVADGLAVADMNGIVWIKAEYSVVFDIDTGDAVAGGWLQEGVIKTDFQRPRLDLAIPIRPSRPTPSRDATCQPRRFGSRYPFQNGREPWRVADR